MAKIFCLMFVVALRLDALSCAGGFHDPCQILNENRKVFQGVVLKSLPLMGEDIVRDSFKSTFTWRLEIQVTEGLYGVETGEIVTVYSQFGGRVGATSLHLPYQFAAGKWTIDLGECWVTSMGFYDSLFKYLRDAKVTSQQTASLRVMAMPRYRMFGELAGVPIHIRGPVERLAEADSKGVAHFKDLPPGAYEVSIEAPGYVPVKSKERVTVAPLSCGFHLIEVEGALSVSGRVTDPDGKPLNRALVSLRHQTAEFRLERGLGTRTGPDGSYRINGVPPGNFVLTASPELCCVYEGEPGTLERTVFRLPPESKTGMDLVAIRRRVRQVRFQLIAPDGTPLANSKAQVVSYESEQWGHENQYLTTDQDGFATLKLMDYGSYQITWNHSLGPSYFVTESLELRPEGPSGPIRMALRKIR